MWVVYLHKQHGVTEGKKSPLLIYFRKKSQKVEAEDPVFFSVSFKNLFTNGKKLNNTITITKPSSIPSEGVRNVRHLSRIPD